MKNLCQSWESHLVEQIRKGDEIAFDLFMDTYRPMLTGLALRKLHNTEDAKTANQLVQEAGART